MRRSRPLRWRYYAYKAATTMGPYLPVYAVYVLDQGYGLAFVAFMQAVFSLVLLAAELPAGYLGDRIGRRWTLVAANCFRVAGVAGYVVATSPDEFLFLKVLTGVSWALRSGAEDAWLYELLGAHDDPDAFVRVSSRGRTALLGTSAVGAVTRLAGGEVAAAISPVAFLAAAGTVLSLSAGVLWIAVSPVRPTEAATDGAAVGDD